MTDVSEYELGRLAASVDALTVQVTQNNERLTELEQQLNRTRGIGIGIVLATVGLSGVGASLFTKWLGT